MPCVYQNSEIDGVAANMAQPPLDMVTFDPSGMESSCLHGFEVGREN
jgi:hypothetical protein